jgi:hypothetical protein
VTLANRYAINTRIRLSSVFTDALGAFADPTVVIFKTKDPTGSITTISGGNVIKDSTGKYHTDVTPALQGDWFYYGNGTGAVIASDENTFIIKESEFF